MKKELPPGLLIGAALVVLGVLALMAWKFFGPEPPPQDTPEARAAAQRIADSFRNQQRPPGADSRGGGGGGLPPGQALSGNR